MDKKSQAHSKRAMVSIPKFQSVPLEFVQGAHLTRTTETQKRYFLSAFQVYNHKIVDPQVEILSM